MATVLVLSPLTVALIALLTADSSFNSLCRGGVTDDVPQGVTWPFGLVEVKMPRDLSGFGTGTLPEVEVLLHIFSKQESMKEAELAMNRAIELWKHASITVTGFDQCGDAFWCDDVTPIPNTVVNGVQCHELVGRFRGYFEKAA